ncbi:MAG: hypothetical protein ACSW8F_01375 [bacterium]
MDVRAIVSRRLSGTRLFHALVLTGGDAAMREEAAKVIAQLAVCEHPEKAPCGFCRHCQKAERGVHPDISWVEKKADKKELTVDLMRSARQAALVRPNEAARSVTIIRDADLMNPEAQNAMLKVFEEPAPFAVFVLLAANAERLLPTVRSRCEELLLPPAPEPENPQAAELVEALCRGDGVALVKALGMLGKLDRPGMTDLIAALRREALSAYLRGSLTQERLARLTEAADTCDRSLAVNVSVSHVSGVLVAAML